MTLAPLPISIVIPTCNRRRSVLRLLQSLAADADAPEFEAIVVDDGSTDDTVAALTKLQLPFALRVLSQRSCGPSTARNAGVRAAQGRVVLFLDDDVEVLPGIVAAHVAFHADREDRLGIGDLPPVVTERSLFGVTLRGWWDRSLSQVRTPGHRFGFRDVLTGHLSILRSQFERLGGFDPGLRCHEDWEFGYRAIRAGLQLRLVPGAAALHHESSDLRKVLRRKFDEGVADVALARRYPELSAVLPFSWVLRSRKMRLLKRLAWTPWAAAPCLAAIDTAMRTLSAANLRYRWRAMLDLLLVHWYWRGIASVVSTPRHVQALLPKDAPAVPEVVLDLAAGLEAAAAHLDAVKPMSAALKVRDELVGVVYPVAGLEPLRGEHLRPLLAGLHRRAFTAALRRAGLVPAVFNGASADARGNMPDPRTPLVGDVQLPADGRSGLDMHRRSAVPPVHHVA